MKKSLFESKTVVFNLIVLLATAVANFIPDADAFVATHSVEILAGLGLANLLLRRLTKSAYTIFPILIGMLALGLSSCTVGVDPVTGERSVTIDGVAAGNIITSVLNEK